MAVVIFVLACVIAVFLADLTDPIRTVDDVDRVFFGEES